MADTTSLNGTEFTYDQKSEGKVKIKRTLMLVLYIVFGGGLFAGCMAINPYLFAIGPLSVYILYLLTWRLVAYDCYWEFGQGNLEVGTVRVSKHGRSKTMKLRVHVKEALEIGCYESSEQIKGAEKLFDYSQSPTSDKRVYIIFEKDGKRCVLLIEATAKLGNLLESFCPNAKGTKGKAFHG